jgi:hypothetical protein
MRRWKYTNLVYCSRWSNALSVQRDINPIADVLSLLSAGKELAECGRVDREKNKKQQQEVDRKQSYTSLDCSFTLKVLVKWTCKCCHQTIVPHGLSCFPSSPELEHLWYALTVLQQFKRIGLGGGTSATCEVGLESALGLLSPIISSNDVKSLVTLAH